MYYFIAEEFKALGTSFWCLTKIKQVYFYLMVKNYNNDSY